MTTKEKETIPLVQLPDFAKFI